MITYLYFLGEFLLSRAAKAVQWISKSLFLNNFLSEGRRRSRAMVLTKKGFHGEEEDEIELGLGSVRFTQGLGRKRVLITKRIAAVKTPATESPPVKKQRNRATVSSSSFSEKSRLETLPQDLLIRVICCVDHDDLQSLILVSKSIRESSLIAKKLHFAYTTPKKIRAFRNPLALEEVSGSSCEEEDSIEAPNAPFHYRWDKAKRKEQLSSVSVALFT